VALSRGRGRTGTPSQCPGTGSQARVTVTESPPGPVGRRTRPGDRPGRRRPRRHESRAGDTVAVTVTVHCPGAAAALAGPGDRDS
jgi:hypothetical protein